MAALPDEARWMRRALELARRGFTPPNPMVGCVLVRDGQVVGEGYHHSAGLPHAEVEALRAAGPASAGSTAFVTLEPCCHYGRTPPCTGALIKAGVARVVVAVADPNPAVDGGGIAILRAAGIQVDVGLLEEKARRLNAAYFHYHATGRPYVTLKTAISLDGKIATRTGDSKWITGPSARRLVHRLRGQSGAVLCGIGTVLADDPLLTARLPGMPRQPLRVILDTSLRTPLGSRLVETSSAVPVLIATGDDACTERAHALEDAGVEIVRFSTDRSKGVPVDLLLDELGRRGIISLLVEGGGRVNASFLASGHVNRLLWFVSPLVIGGADAPTSVEGSGAERISDALRLGRLNCRRIGPDLLVESLPESAEKESGK